MEPYLLEVKKLAVAFRTVQGRCIALKGVDFTMRPGETLGIVGESGSGKSLTALSIMRLVPNPPGEITGGEIRFQGKNLLSLSTEDMQKIRGNKISMIFQEPMTSLNPLHTCGRQIREPLMIHRGFSEKAASKRALEYLRLVGIPSPEQRFHEFPHQLSGGMRQRIMIAMALVCEPKLILADEPTTALDVTIQAQILELLRTLREKIDAGIVMITHDMGIIADICHRVLVMYAGQIVESSPLKEIFREPLHPYTQGLLQSIPRIQNGKKRLFSIDGTVPSPFDMPKGCAFQPRCTRSLPVCREKEPALVSVNAERRIRCWRYERSGTTENHPKEM